MTRVVASELHDDDEDARLVFGDPIGCHYRAVDPAEVEAYGDSLRAVATKVGLAETAFRATATMPEESFAGEAADALRGRASRRLEEAEALRDHLRTLGRALADHAGFLRRHRESLEALRDLALSHGLRVEGHRIQAPAATVRGDASQRELDAWEADWKAYQECFEAKRDIVAARREAGHALAAVVRETTGVTPADVDRTGEQSGHGRVDFGDLRRAAAAESMEAVEARDDLQAAQATVERLKGRYGRALDELERLVVGGASSDEVAAQASRVQLLDRELDSARAEAREASDTFQDERREAGAAVRELRDAQRPGPHAVAEQAGLAPVHDLRDRLG